jgi:hypothetical protein
MVDGVTVTSDTAASLGTLGVITVGLVKEDV